MIWQGFLLGLSTGVFCLGYCAPVFVPYVLAEARPRFGMNLGLVGQRQAGEPQQHAVEFRKLASRRDTIHNPLKVAHPTQAHQDLQDAADQEGHQGHPVLFADGEQTSKHALVHLTPPYLSQSESQNRSSVIPRPARNSLSNLRQSRSLGARRSGTYVVSVK